MNKLLSIGQASKTLGVTIQTLRNWDKKGLLKPDELTKGGERRYKLESLKKINRNITFNKDELKTIAYARVSSHDQKDDLVRQVQILELYCSKQGFKYEVIQDLGSGMNYYKKGLTKLLNLILEGEVKRLVLTHKDRLLRFGAELVFSICEAKEVEVIIINKGEENVKFFASQSSHHSSSADDSLRREEEELAKDVLEIITVFSARLYGSRSKKNKKLLTKMQEVVEDNVK
ncbi:MAG: IS607 family transposase [Arcobacter sp.]|nr:IS607 family transposase [Arcobacter sp.]